jgi:hypothetical protein
MNLNLIKDRLNKLQSKTGNSNYEKIDFAALFWKPKLGKQTVRILPRKANRDYPFTEVSFHQYNVFKKNIYSLENFGEKDPVVQLVKDLYTEGTDESKDLAKKLKPRTKYFANVIVRGEEGAGVRIWEFNKTTYEKLLSIMADDDFGDITDLTQGTDLTVEGYNDVIKIGKRDVTYIAVNVTPKRNISPVHTDASKVEEYLENQKDILEIYKKYSFDEIKNLLKAYISPESQEATDDEDDKVEIKKDTTDDTEEAPFEVTEEPTPSVANSEKRPAAKKNLASKFEDLFPDDED